MYVLFSPIGNSDPWRYERDGAMLHIVRHYKPKKVVLFFTKSIYEGADKFKSHKKYPWEMIIQVVSPDTIVQKVVADIERPNDYDVYRELFHHHIEELHREYRNAKVILNVTSGTPQMGSTLCLEYITYPENKLAMQVSTPENASNAGKEHSNPVDIEDTLKCVNELEADYTSRCTVLNLLSFKEALWKSLIVEFLDSYDYLGAEKFFKKLEKNKPVEILKRKRKEINSQTIFKEFNDLKIDNSALKALCAYLVLKLRHNQKNYSDVLIRTKSLAEFICYHYLIRCNLIEKSEAEFLTIKDDMILSKVKKDIYGNAPKKLHVYSTMFRLSKDDIAHKCTESVIDINEARNNVAHNLEELDIDVNKLNNAVAAIERLLQHAFPEISKEHYNFFEDFNDKLKKQL